MSIPSPLCSFIPGLKPSFSANPSHRSLQDWLHGFTDTSEHIRFLLYSFFSVFPLLVVGSVRSRHVMSAHVSFWAHGKIASRIASYDIVNARPAVSSPAAPCPVPTRYCICGTDESRTRRLSREHGRTLVFRFGGANPPPPLSSSHFPPHCTLQVGLLPPVLHHLPSLPLEAGPLKST